MRLSDEEISLVKARDDKTIEKLLELYLYMVKSPVYDAVLTLRVTVDSWCKEVLDEKPKILGGKKDDDANDKAIERVRKMLLDLPQLVLECEKLQAKLTGDDIVKLQQDNRIKDGGDRAFGKSNGSTNAA